jgi:hypothetical protein
MVSAFALVPGESHLFPLIVVGLIGPGPTAGNRTSSVRQRRGWHLQACVVGGTYHFHTKCLVGQVAAAAMSECSSSLLTEGSR